MTAARRIARILGRGVRLRCPRCGVGPLFRGPFRMHEECLVCALPFEREQGYFVGAIYVNYAATAVLVVAAFVLLQRFPGIPVLAQLVLGGLVAVLVPLGFFRHSRSLWMSLDHIVNPAEEPPRVGPTP
ncbi:MAG TPA: DUF983 domain-containing protein [Candidatus Methylomirabilis sp.]|jgi:uncharacterized protein (DUF983 family)|nr:DUF983 domain-containing protein [Candidatus Methylomirabilis sp.]